MSQSSKKVLLLALLPAMIQVANADISIGDNVHLGVNATVSGQGIAIGKESSAVINHGVAVGVKAEAGSTATAYGYNAKATNFQAVAMGDSAKATGIRDTAVGAYSEASGNGSAAFGTFSKALGGNSVAVGNDAQANGHYAVALGLASRAEKDAIAMGRNANAAGEFSTALGRGANATEKDSLAIGRNAQATHAGSVALGLAAKADGSTLANTAYLADNPSNNIKGASAIGELNIGQYVAGQADQYRRITGLAAGAEDTDAVNVSQLKEAVSASGSWNLSTNGTNTAKVTPNATVNFSGDQNITVSNNGTDVTVELDKDLDLSALGSLTIGGTVINAQGLSIAGANGYSPITIHQGNISFGGNVLTNVGKGVNDSDAVNLGQLNDALANVGGGAGSSWNLTTNGQNSTEVKPNATVDFSGDSNINVSNTGNGIKVELDKNLDLSAQGSVTVGDTKLDDSGLAVGNITIKEGNVNVAGNQINNVGTATEDHQAVNLGQLNQGLAGIDDKIKNNGWNITGKDQNGQTVTEKVKADSTVEFAAGPSGNTTVTTEVTANGSKVTVDLADKIKLTEQGSLTIAAGQGNEAITVQQGNVSVGGNQIHNVAAGTHAKDAVNVDQLTSTVNIFGGGAGFNSQTGEIIAPTYTVGGGSYHNVGDALGALNQADINLGNQITNLQYNFNNRIDDVEDRMSAGIAAAMALENAPYIPGKYTYSAATAYHNGQAALGVTLRKTADNGRWSLTGGVAAGTEGDPSVRVGVSGVID